MILFAWEGCVAKGWREINGGSGVCRLGLAIPKSLG